MIKLIVTALLSLALSITPCASYFGLNQFARPRIIMHRAACVTSDLDQTTYDFTSAGLGAITFSGLDDSAPVYIILIIGSRDSALTFGVSSLTVDGSGYTEAFDLGGNQLVSVAGYRTPTDSLTSNAASIDVSVTFSEAITGAVVCAWVVQDNEMPGFAPNRTGVHTSSSIISMTASQNASPGFSSGMCINDATGQTTTWGGTADNMVEQEDTCTGEFCYSSVDNATAINDGTPIPSLLAAETLTCDYTGSADASSGWGGAR